MFSPKSYHSVSKIIVNEFRLILNINGLIRILIPPKQHARNCAVQSRADNLAIWCIGLFKDIRCFLFCGGLFDFIVLFVY